MTDQERLESEKAGLIELCKDYNDQDFVAAPIKTLMHMLSNTLHALEGDEFDPEYVRDTTFQVTHLMWFLAALHEKVVIISDFENRVKQKES